MCQLTHFSNGNFSILKWRYVSTIFQAIFCGDIPSQWNPLFLLERCLQKDRCGHLDGVSFNPWSIMNLRVLTTRSMEDYHHDRNSLYYHKYYMINIIYIIYINTCVHHNMCIYNVYIYINIMTSSRNAHLHTTFTYAAGKDICSTSWMKVVVAKVTRGSAVGEWSGEWDRSWSTCGYGSK